MNRWRYWPQLCPLHALLQLGQQEESPSQVLWRNNQPDLSLKRIGRSPQNTTKEETEPFSFSWRTTSQSEQWSYLHLPRSLVCFLLWTVNKLLSESGQGCIYKRIIYRVTIYNPDLWECGGFFDKRYNSPIYRRWMHSLGTRSEGIFGVKRYNSPIYRDLLHSLGTRSEDNFLKVFNTSL